MTKFINRYLLVLFLTPLAILFILSGYLRFVVNNDYLIYYQTDCNPNRQTCYAGCANDENECTEKYYFKKIERSAKELNKLCGSNILGCTPANSCVGSKEYCKETLCNNSTDNCSVSGLESESNSRERTKNELITNQDNV